MATIPYSLLRPARFAKEIWKWIEVTYKFLSAPNFPGDVNVGGDLSVEGDGAIAGDLVVTGDTTSNKYTLSSPRWDDMRVPLSSVRLPAANAPTWTAYKGSFVLAFDGTSTDTIYFAVQIPHKYQEGTDIDAHIHWVAEDNTAGNVLWRFTYSWANIDGTFPVETSVDKLIATSEVTDKHILTDIVDITGTSKTISGMLLCSLARIGGDASDTYDAKDAYFLEFDFHFRTDTPGGSTTEDAK